MFSWHVGDDKKLKKDRTRTRGENQFAILSTASKKKVKKNSKVITIVIKAYVRIYDQRAVIHKSATSAHGRSNISENTRCVPEFPSSCHYACHNFLSTIMNCPHIFATQIIIIMLPLSVCVLSFYIFCHHYHPRNTFPLMDCCANLNLCPLLCPLYSLKCLLKFLGHLVHNNLQIKI